MVLRRVFFVFVLLAPFTAQTTPPLLAQTASGTSSQVTADELDARLFSVLFRRVNLYEKAAKAASSPDKPEARLNTVMPRTLNLTPGEADSLRRISLQWEQDRTPIHDQVRQVILKHHEAVTNNGSIPPIDTTLPGSLRALQGQIDAVTLHYRDLLRNEMPENDFQKLEVNLQTLFAGNAGTFTK